MIITTDLPFPVADVDVAAVAAAIGDRTRCSMLHALLDSPRLPATDLARRSGVTASTASEHLDKLVGAGLIHRISEGRNRYYRLAGREVAGALEALSVLARPVPVRSLRQSTRATALAEARTCYDHLAGRLGVAVMDEFLRRNALAPMGPDDRDHSVTATGRRLLARLGIDVTSLSSQRRALARTCVDWTERRPHLAGAVGAAICTTFLDGGWAVRRPDSRALVVTELGKAELRRWLGSRAVAAG